MKLEDFHKSIRLSLIVIARFGFISKDFFFDKLTPRNPGHKYTLWNMLIETGFLRPYQRIGIANEYYSFSQKGHYLMRENGFDPVSRAHPLHFEHDEVVMSLAVSCELAGLIKPDWSTDKELRQFQPQELFNRFGRNNNKLPDLIFDIDLGVSKIQCAFEVERSRKSKIKYDSIVLDYAKDKNINLVLVAYKDKYVMKSILQSIKRLGYPQSSKPIIFCRINDVVKLAPSFQIELGANQILFDQYIRNLRILSVNRPEKMTGKLSGKNSGQKVGAA